ncbi:protein phosphatase CheZ [Methylobacterium sp. J-076]|uniref:protein phosphatase CheZ n=1 Tax=Methylobacterium sp. J-076 TaxID=2836655 RepID=UPI001FBAEB40|nr:protein phosphatase CheZ [Methylobacterium sp. J-076]MCJ2012909.1 protein phosphatase CheZ [Methylobacterium sp. J-076]
MKTKRYRIEQSLGLETPAPIELRPAGRDDEILSAIGDLRRIMQSSASETVEACRKELNDALAMRGELDMMKDAIVRTKADLAALHRSDVTGKGMRRAADELDAVVESTERATTTLLSVVEDVESRASMLRSMHLTPDARPHVDAILDQVIRAYEACNFQDLTGQRISKIVQVMKFIEEHLDRVITAWSALDSFRDLVAAGPQPDADDEGALLNGPKLPDDPGHVDQSDIDALFD